MKVAMEELTTLQSEMNRSMKDVLARLEQVKSKMKNIQIMNSFEGKAADSAKLHFQHIHGNRVNEMKSTIGLLQDNLNHILSDFQTVDQSSSAILTEDYLNETDKKVLNVHQNLMVTHDKGAETVRDVADLVPVYMPSIAHIENTIKASSTYIQQVNQKLYQFDKKALQKVNESKIEVQKLKNKLAEDAANSLSALGSTLGDVEGLGLESATDSASKDRRWLAVVVGYKVIKNINKYLNKTDKYMTMAIQGLILAKVNKQNLTTLLKKGEHSLTKNDYRKFNNYMRSTLYKIDGKKFMEYIKTYKLSALKKENFPVMMEYIQAYDVTRGKYVLQQEFDRLYGLTKYKELKSLSRAKQALKVASTFGEEFAGNKYKAVKKAVHALPEWKNPRQAFRNRKQTFKANNKDLNNLGKTMKVLGKGMGAVSFGLIVADNYKTYKGDTQKVVVGTTVDTVISAGAAAAGAAVGSAFLPPIGTVVGAGVGMGASAFFNLKAGTPPKTLSSHIKNFADAGVDKTVKAAKKIGGTISNWFK